MNTEDNKQVMAANIKRCMDSKGVTNQQLCDDLGFKYTTFVDWIKGVTYPRIGKIEAMAAYFGCQKSDLIEEKKPTATKDDRLSAKKQELFDMVNALSEEDAALVLAALKAKLSK